VNIDTYTTPAAPLLELPAVSCYTCGTPLRMFRGAWLEEATGDHACLVVDGITKSHKPGITEAEVYMTALEVEAELREKVTTPEGELLPIELLEVEVLELRAVTLAVLGRSLGGVEVRCNLMAEAEAEVWWLVGTDRESRFSSRRAALVGLLRWVWQARAERLAAEAAR
jgi:hypothetical protein